MLLSMSEITIKFFERAHQLLKLRAYLSACCPTNGFVVKLNYQPAFGPHGGMITVDYERVTEIAVDSPTGLHGLPVKVGISTLPDRQLLTVHTVSRESTSGLNYGCCKELKKAVSGTRSNACKSSPIQTCIHGLALTAIIVMEFFTSP